MKNPQSGQVLLIILLVMFIGLTVSLSLLFRTTTDIKLSRELEESSQALSAAEAGIEETLRTGMAAPGEVAPGVTYEVDMQEASHGSGIFSLGKIERENVGTVWLADYGTWSQAYDVDRIALCFSEADSDVPSIEAVTLYQDGSEHKAARDFFVPPVSGSSDPNACDDPSRTYSYQTDVTLPMGPNVVLLALRLKPVGGDAFVAVDPPEEVAGNSLPSQGREVISTGKAGDTIRRVRVVKSYPSWPEIFDYVLFSGGSLSK